MTIAEVIALIVALGTGLYALIRHRSQPKDAQLEKLATEKAGEVAKTEQLKAEQATLKEQVEQQEANKTEEEKQNFWRDYVAAKKNAAKPTDSK